MNLWLIIALKLKHKTRMFIIKKMGYVTKDQITVTQSCADNFIEAYR